jgi:hypothetical protein
MKANSKKGKIQMNLIRNMLRPLAFAGFAAALAPNAAEAQECAVVSGGFQPPTFVFCDTTEGFVSADGPTDTVRALLTAGARVKVTGRDQNGDVLYPGQNRCTATDAVVDSTPAENTQCQDNGAKLFNGVLGQAFAS